MAISIFFRSAQVARNNVLRQPSLDIQFRTYASRPHFAGYRGHGKRKLILGLGIAGAAYYLYQKPRNNHVACDGATDTSGKREKAFGGWSFQTLTLRETEEVGKNTKLFRFDLPKEDQIAGHSVSSAVLARIAKPGTENNWWPSYVYRPYTPVSEEETVGHIDFVVKGYENGTASKYIHALKPGDKMQVWGPMPGMKYQANKFECIGLIAGGSGITPMVQLLRKVINNPEDKTKVNLLYCNRTEEDILLREELESMAKKNPDRFKITYCLSQPPSDWKEEAGRVNLDMIKAHMPAPSPKTMIFVCGPDGMIKTVAGGKTSILKQLGYSKKSITKISGLQINYDSKSQ